MRRLAAVVLAGSFALGASLDAARHADALLLASGDDVSATYDRIWIGDARCAQALCIDYGVPRAAHDVVSDTVFGIDADAPLAAQRVSRYQNFASVSADPWMAAAKLNSSALRAPQYARIDSSAESDTSHVDVQFTTSLSQLARSTVPQLRSTPASATNALQARSAFAAASNDSSTAPSAIQFSVPVYHPSWVLGTTLRWDGYARKAPLAAEYHPFNPASPGPDAGAAVTADLPPATYTAASPASVSASLPINKRITLGGLYNQEFFSEYYQNPTFGVQQKTSAQGSITYGIPNSRTAITFFFRNTKYTDSIVPLYNYDENREDLIYSVRF